MYLVDDDRNLCDLVERFLDRAGYQIKVFHDGESFLAAMGAMLPDVICLDLSMPGIGGLETLDVIKERHRHLPVIAASVTAVSPTTITVIGPFASTPSPTRIHNATGATASEASLRTGSAVAGTSRRSPEGCPGLAGSAARPGDLRGCHGQRSESSSEVGRAGRRGE